MAKSLGHQINSPQYFADLGAVAADRQQFDLATEYYRKATQIDPGYLVAYQELAALYEKLKKKSLAIDTFLELIRRLPNVPALHIKVAGLMSEEKRPAQAIEQYRTALRINPNEMIAANNLAWLLATCRDQNLRDGQQAIKLAKQACEASKNQNPGFLDTLAAAYAEVGQYDEAIRTLNAATTIAQKLNLTSFVAASRGRLALYEAGRPYREG